MERITLVIQIFCEPFADIHHNNKSIGETKKNVGLENRLTDRQICVIYTNKNGLIDHSNNAVKERRSVKYIETKRKS